MRHSREHRLGAMEFVSRDSASRAGDSQHSVTISVGKAGHEVSDQITSQVEMSCVVVRRDSSHKPSRRASTASQVVSIGGS
jgi:hypothetical protein